MQIDLRFGDQLSAICVLPVIFDVPILRLDKLIWRFILRFKLLVIYRFFLFQRWQCMGILSKPDMSRIQSMERASHERERTSSLVTVPRRRRCSLIGFAFSDDIKSGNGPANCRSETPAPLGVSLHCCQNTVADLHRMSRCWHAPSFVVDPAALYSIRYAFFPPFIPLCRRRAAARPRTPVQGRINQSSEFRLFPSTFNAVREQRETSAKRVRYMISRVISESHYILGVS